MNTTFTHATDASPIKGILIGLAFYLIASTAAVAVVVSLWMPAGVEDAKALSDVAESDERLLSAKSSSGLCWGLRPGLSHLQLAGEAPELQRR